MFLIIGKNDIDSSGNGDGGGSSVCILTIRQQQGTRASKMTELQIVTNKEEMKGKHWMQFLQIVGRRQCQVADITKYWLETN